MPRALQAPHFLPLNPCCATPTLCRRAERMKANELHHKALQMQADMLRERQAQQ